MGETAGMAGVMPRAEEAVRRFCAQQERDATASGAARLRRAEQDLRACLDALAPLLLTGQEQALLALERQFEADGATARVAGAEALLLVLPVYLDEPRWHGEDVADRRLRIRFARDLADTIAEEAAHRGVDLGRAPWVVDAAVRHETWMLRQERAAARGR